MMQELATEAVNTENMRRKHPQSWLAMFNISFCAKMAVPGVCVCRGSYNCSPSFPVMLRQVARSCKCFVA